MPSWSTSSRRQKVVIRLLLDAICTRTNSRSPRCSTRAVVTSAKRVSARQQTRGSVGTSASAGPDTREGSAKTKDSARGDVVNASSRQAKNAARRQGEAWVQVRLQDRIR